MCFGVFFIEYHFGSRKLTVVRPTEGYPTESEASQLPEASLVIDWIHGFVGNKEDGFKSLDVSEDGSKLIYFVACFGVVYDVIEKTQAYFQGHSDDVTCIAVNSAEGSSLVATGQKDPKDEHGKGKSLPFIAVWDYKTMKTVAVMDDVSERKVKRLAWSNKTGMLYAICGDDDQTLKGYSPENFKKKGSDKSDLAFPTYRQEMFGFVCNPCGPSDEANFDEFVGFGKRQFTWFVVTGNGEDVPFGFGKKNVSITKFAEDGEKAFTDCIYLPGGRYAVSGVSGNVYLCLGSDCLGCVKAHDKATGALGWLEAESRLVTVGHDEKVKMWSLPEEDDAGLTMESEEIVTVEDSDFCFRPKAMAISGSTLFVGSKTNQILQYACGEDEKTPPEVIVDGHDGQSMC